MIHSAEAIVLRCIDYSNTSQILHLFTNGQGKISVMAKGVKRQTKTNLSGGLELLSHVTVVYFQKSIHQMAVLNEWSLKDHFPLLRRNLYKLFFAQYWLEMVNEGLEDYQANPALFQSFSQGLRQLAATAVPRSLFFGVQWKLLEALGFAPYISSCLHCQTSLQQGGCKNVLFSPKQGGILCPACHRYAQGVAIQLHATTLAKMNHIIDNENNWEKILLTAQEHHELHSLFRFHLHHAWQKELRMSRYIEAAGKH